MKKRILTVIMSLVLMIGAMSVTAMAAEIVDSGKCGDNLTWMLDSNGKFTVSGEGKMYEYNDFEQPWAEHTTEIHTLIIEEGVTNITNGAFAFCENLTSISIPASVTDVCVWEDVGCASFYSCYQMEKVIVDEDNKHYSSDEYGVMFNKDKSELIYAPLGGMHGSYTIPDGVEIIGNFSFYCCRNLEEVTIPSSVYSVGTYAFGGCTNLERIIVDKDNKSYFSDEGGVLFNKDKSELVCVPPGKTDVITIPASVTEFEWSAFSDANSNEIIKYEGDALSVLNGFWWPLTIYYPDNNSTWTKAAMEEFGDDITWKTYSPDEAFVVEKEEDIPEDALETVPEENISEIAPEIETDISESTTGNAEPEIEEESADAGAGIGLYIAIGVVILVCAGFGTYMLIKKRKTANKENAEN